MKLTFVTEPGETFVVETDENMELENVMALLEAKVGSLFTPIRSPPSMSLFLCLMKPS